MSQNNVYYKRGSNIKQAELNRFGQRVMARELLGNSTLRETD